MGNRAWKTAAELMADLEQNPDYQRRMAEKQRRRDAKEKQFREMERPILDRLVPFGFVAESIQDATNKYAPLCEGIVAILLDGISQSSDPILLESMIRALAAADQPFDGRVLIEKYGNTTDENLRWVILNTIACNAPHSIDDWINELMKSPYVAKTLHELGFEERSQRKP